MLSDKTKAIRQVLTLHRILLVAPLMVATITLAASNQPPNAAGRKPTSFSQLQKGFSQPDMIYAPFAFWFWDAPLDEQLAADMAETMSRQRMNPGYAHPRKGLPPEQWLSEKWFTSVNAALKKAEAAGAYLGYCDEYWWPSGRADGRVLRAHPELKSVSLKYTIINVTGPREIQLKPAFFTVAAQIVKQPGNTEKAVKIKSQSLRIIAAGESAVWSVPDGRWRIYAFSKYHHGGIDGGDVNYIDRRLPGAFIEIAHQPYAEFFGSRMGKSIPGVFIDNEGDYGYKLAWSGDFEKEYKQKKGRDIRLWMPLLLDEDVEGRWAKARWDWYDVVSALYADNYLGQVSRWLAERGMYDISNLWEENLLAQAVAVGDFFQAQRSVTMPGNDCLLQKALQVHDFKETQSVTEFEGSRFQSEVLGVAGWQMTPILMKQAANAVIAWGVSHVVPHGVNFNRQLNTIPYPPDWFHCNPYWPYFHLWTDFVRRASYVNSHGHLVPDVLLVNPMDSIWALAGADIFDINEPLDVGKLLFKPEVRQLTGNAPLIEEIENTYAGAINDLTAARIEFLIADRLYIRQMTVKSNGGLIRQPFEFKAVVLPPMFILPLDVAEKILDFARAGGSVYLLGRLPEGSTNNGLDDPKMKKLMERLTNLPTVHRAINGIGELVEQEQPHMQSQIVFKAGRFPMNQLHRRIDGRDFFWLVNNTAKRHDCTLAVRDVTGRAAIWDCETGTQSTRYCRQTPFGSTIQVTFEPYQAFWLVFNPQSELIKPQQREKAKWTTMVEISGPWTVCIDKSVQPPSAAPALGAPEALLAKGGVQRPLQSWLKWNLDQFSGYVDYQTTFHSDVDGGCVLLELGKVKYMAEVWVNGKPVGYRLWPPFKFEIGMAVHKGQNQLKVRVGNLLCNAMKQYVTDENRSRFWIPSPPTQEQFDAGLFGPVTIKTKK